ncbi:hypothetical protein [Halococcoides cellulosivorans]|uniref:Uncharacterized protein n=1 Tax=Halococcoides cellulosivorans TaxID=1679096 RepID=A0A2R4X3T7_9EURY|nr:hypothetical protein [Halococcoides cellulosivorans]AWB28461.1 hypothetical protein HARCEL1_12495 [Halococcoides cellulosivorans]
MASSVQVKDLDEVEPTGNYIVVYAWVTYIEDLDAHKPYQKGMLGDDSSRGIEPRKFVVYDPDLRLEKGNTYKIFGKERGYEKLDEIQILISDADHVELVHEGD